MKGFGIPFLFAGLLCLAPIAKADEGSLPFRDAFRAYVKVRQLEEQNRINQNRHDLEEGARQTLEEKLSAQLTEARIDFQAFLQPDFQGLSPWESAVLKQAGKRKTSGVDKIALDFLNRTYQAKAREWTPIEWETAGDWFGTPTEDAFLKVIFAIEAVPSAHPAPQSAPTLVWVNDPLLRYLPKADGERLRAELQRERKSLEQQGFKVEVMEIGAFSRLDEQAEGVHLALLQRINAGSDFTLISSGYASAVLLHALDTNPGLLQNPAITGWANVNGQLFGEENHAIRNLASASKADKPLSDARQELLLLREERLHSQPPLGARFPILNLVSFGGPSRPGASLRDSLMPEGRTIYVPAGSGVGALGGVLPALGHRAPAGQRDETTGDASL